MVSERGNFLSMSISCKENSKGWGTGGARIFKDYGIFAISVHCTCTSAGMDYTACQKKCTNFFFFYVCCYTIYMKHRASKIFLEVLCMKYELIDCAHAWGPHSNKNKQP